MLLKKIIIHHKEGRVSNSSRGRNDLPTAPVDWFTGNYSVQNLEFHVPYGCHKDKKKKMSKPLKHELLVSYSRRFTQKANLLLNGWNI